VAGRIGPTLDSPTFERGVSLDPQALQVIS
jgi:hypothetical protein